MADHCRVECAHVAEFSGLGRSLPRVRQVLEAAAKKNDACIGFLVRQSDLHGALLFDATVAASAAMVWPPVAQDVFATPAGVALVSSSPYTNNNNNDNNVTWFYGNTTRLRRDAWAQWEPYEAVKATECVIFARGKASIADLQAHCRAEAVDEFEDCGAQRWAMNHEQLSRILSNATAAMVSCMESEKATTKTDTATIKTAAAAAAYAAAIKPRLAVCVAEAKSVFLSAGGQEWQWERYKNGVDNKVTCDQSGSDCKVVAKETVIVNVPVEGANICESAASLQDLTAVLAVTAAVDKASVSVIACVDTATTAVAGRRLQGGSTGTTVDVVITAASADQAAIIADVVGQQGAGGLNAQLALASSAVKVETTGYLGAAQEYETVLPAAPASATDAGFGDQSLNGGPAAAPLSVGAIAAIAAVAAMALIAMVVGAVIVNRRKSMLTSHASFCYDTSSSIGVEQKTAVELTKSPIMPTTVVAVGQKDEYSI